MPRKRLLTAEKSDCRGFAAVEALASVLIICLVFFGLMQIFRWAASKMIAEYASTNVAGAYARGYTNAFTRKVGRISAVGASGRDESTPSINMRSSQGYIAERFRRYLENPRTSGVDYEFWDNDSGPNLNIRVSGGDFIRGSVWLDRMPLLHPALDIMLRDADSENGILEGETSFYNYSKHYLVHQ